MAQPRPYGKVNIEITNVCNLQCSFCPEVEREHGRMSPELFERVIRQVAPLADQVCLHLMGEPLSHPQLPRIVELCEAHGARVFLVSNGLLLRERQAELLLRPVFRQVNFSLHSFLDNFPDRDPSSYLERIFAYTERALRERPDLYVNYRLWNLKDTRGTGEGNHELLRRVTERFGAGPAANADVRFRKSHRLQGRLYLHFDTEFTWPALDLPTLGENGRCHGLSTHFGILVDGTVVPCCLDKEAAIPLGNVSEASVSDILERPRARAMLAGFRRGKLVEELCQRCQYIDRFGRPVESRSDFAR